MPSVSFAGAAEAALASAQMTRRDLVAIDPLLRVDPLLQVAGDHAARLRAHPGVVRILRPAELIVDDAEIDERLGRGAVHALENAEVALVERQRGLVERDPTLRIGARVLLGGLQRLHGRAGLAALPLLVRDRLPRR